MSNKKESMINYIKSEGVNPNGDNYYIVDEIIDNKRYDATIVINDDEDDFELDELYELVENGDYYERSNEINNSIIMNKFIEVLEYNSNNLNNV